MIIDLVRKEFVNASQTRDLKFSRKLLVALIKFVSAGLLIALEVFIFISLDEKVRSNSNYGTFDFLILVLFLTLVISIIFTTLKARKVLFNRLDKTILSPLPIPEGEILFSKILYLYILQAITNVLISTPILMCYFITRNYMPTYYVFSIVYSLIISLFGIGISLLLSIVFEYAYRLLKLSDIAQFILLQLLLLLFALLIK